MHNRESEEMYLETILLLGKKNGRVRRVDVASALGVTKPSVTFAIKALIGKGYVRDDESGSIRLTNAGRRVAENVYEKHHLITRLLVYIGAEPDVAEENACRIEHVISADLMETIRRFMDESVDLWDETAV